MAQERLGGLDLYSIEKEVASSIDYSDLVKFVAMKSWKVGFN
jgi:hypothetical protein